MWGRGGSTPGPAAVAPSADLTGTTGCTIPLGASTCNAAIVWTTRGLTGAIVSVETRIGPVGISAATSGTNNARAITAASGTVVTVYDKSTKLAEKTIQGNCAADAVLDDGVCVARRAAPLASAAVLASGTGYVPQVIHVFADGTFQVLKAYVDTGYAIGNCIIRRAVQVASQPLNCGDANGVLHDLSWIKASNRIVAYDGSAGVLPAVTDSVSSDGYWLDVSNTDLGNGWTTAYVGTAASFFTKRDREFLWMSPAGSDGEWLVISKIGHVKALTGV